MNLEYSQLLLHRISVIHILFAQGLLVGLFQLPLGYLLVQDYSLTFNPLSGLFGFLHPQNVILCLFVNSFVNQVLYQLFFLGTLKYYTTVTLASAMLLE